MIAAAYELTSSVRYNIDNKLRSCDCLPCCWGFYYHMYSFPYESDGRGDARRIVLSMTRPPSSLGLWQRSQKPSGSMFSCFINSPSALHAGEGVERIELLITRMEFRLGQPHGVALARITRMKQRGVKESFMSRPENV